MPSAAAANVKVEKQIGDTAAAAAALADNSTPLRQAITVIEHKIRNLEKRKSKLESYKELQNAGKTLNEDQKTAVEKYNEVLQTLEFARDLNKQFIGIVNVTEKEAKKQAKREAALKNQQELARLREILLIQDALNQMGTDQIREDFLQGKNGAAQISDGDLKLLDDLYPAVVPKHEAGNPTVFTNEVQAAAEHLLAVVDGKPKEAFGGTYCQVKEILGKIHESGYLDQAQEEPAAAFEASYEEPAAEVPEAAAPLAVQEQEQQQLQQPPPPPQSLLMEAPPPQLQQQQQQQQEVNHQLPPLENLALVVEPQHVQLALAAEKLYQQQQQQQQQQPRPISEMLGVPSFFFLQESEIEPEQIATQTFTNPAFVPGMHLPPSIAPAAAAIPVQHFQPVVPQPMNNLSPQPLQPPPQQLVHHQQHVQHMQKNGGGGGGGGGFMGEEPHHHYDDGGHNNGKYAPRNHYYQNNGYNNKGGGEYNNKDYRPRQNRNGNNNNNNSRSQHHQQQQQPQQQHRH